MRDIESPTQLVDVHNCTSLVVRYTHLIDLGHPELVWELFAEDGIWEFPAAGIALRGRDELRTGIAEHLTGDTWLARHICTNTDITLTDAYHAEGLTYFMNYRHYFDHPVDAAADLDRVVAPIGPVRHIGEYVDRFVRTEDGWRFAHRRTRLAFSYRA
ncbi:MAG: hypothetical protein GC156_04360 [Actinomycetales bacterium]|nr:hypothetical protein [Actinomycetales bacterium]